VTTSFPGVHSFLFCLLLFYFGRESKGALLQLLILVGTSDFFNFEYVVPGRTADIRLRQAAIS
jgi:hypothetical protein